MGKRKQTQVHLALLSSSSYTTQYFQSTLRRLSTVHINFAFLLKYTQLHSITVTLRHTNWPAVSWLQYKPGHGATAECLMSPIQLTSLPAMDEAFLDTHLTACDLHCSGATAAWRAMLIMLHGVTGGLAMSRSLEIWCPAYGHAAQWDGDIHYSTVVKTTTGHQLIVGR